VLCADKSGLCTPMHCLWQWPYPFRIASYRPIQPIHLLRKPMRADLLLCDRWQNSAQATYCEKSDINKIKIHATRCRDSISAKAGKLIRDNSLKQFRTQHHPIYLYRYVVRGCILNCFMMPSLPCFNPCF